MRHVIDFNAAGTVSAQYREGGRSIGFLGKQKITRASEVLHDFESQTFYVVIEEDNEDKIIPPCAKGFLTYEEGREFEAAWLDECRIAGASPLTFQGQIIGEDIRRQQGDMVG